MVYSLWVLVWYADLFGLMLVLWCCYCGLRVVICVWLMFDFRLVGLGCCVWMLAGGFDFALVFVWIDLDVVIW